MLAPASDSFGYDAVGDQNTRPGGATLTYRPFDLPKTIKQGASAISFAYDGDEQRIRKTTSKEETLYFEDFYERVTAMGTFTAHRYYVHSPERAVAVVTRGGKQPGTRYTHVDHLGSVDVLTDESGAVVERRSYDPFGQRRNPVWGQPPLASYSSLTTQGFTGHESDDELGLVNMKGRIFDPKVGRFLTTDPIVSTPLSGQGWNPYSYVLGNPLSLVDPSGFEPEPEPVRQSEIYRDADGHLGLRVWYNIPNTTEPQDQANREALQVGATTQPVDVGTTGSSSGYVPQPVTTAPQSWTQNPYLQVEGGFLGGAALGAVPFAGMGQQVLDAADVLPHGTPEARRGLAVGQIFGGIATFVGGVTGEILGGFATTTGFGAAVGVPAMVVSTGLILGGIANIGAGVRGLLTTGSGGGSAAATPTPPAASEGTATGSGAGERGGRGRFKTSEEDVDQLHGIEEHKDRLKPSRKAQEGEKTKDAINSTQKSQQRLNNRLNRTKNAKDWEE